KRRKLDMYEYTVARAPVGGLCTHAALINSSISTAWFRRITSFAKTARCLGVPGGTMVLPTHISNRPRMLNRTLACATVLSNPSLDGAGSAHCERRRILFGTRLPNRYQLSKLVGETVVRAGRAVTRLWFGLSARAGRAAVIVVRSVTFLFNSSIRGDGRR